MTTGPSKDSNKAPLEAAPFLTFPRKRGQGLVGQNKLSYAPNPILARASPCPRLRGKVRKGAASSGAHSGISHYKNFQGTPMQTILGIDPGSRITGYGIIRSDGQRHLYVASGVVKILKQDIGGCLSQIFQGVSEIVQLYHPMQAAIEQVFLARNANSALKLGQARGAAIVAMAIQGLTIAEYSARSIKQAVVGYGAAQKEQVQHMVKLLLNLPKAPSADAADALAVAICHAQTCRNIKIQPYLQPQKHPISGVTA